MTSANVKGLNSLMNFVGTQATAQNKGMQSQMNFGDVMAKTESKDQSNTQTDAFSQTKTQKPSFSDRASKVKDITKSEPKDMENVEEPKELSDEDIAKLSEAASTVVNEIAKELEVPVEIVEDAMDDLGLSDISMLDASNIGDVVLSVSGETDPMVLVTDEDIFNTVNDLTTMVDATVADLAEDMDIEVDALKGMIEDIKPQDENLKNSAFVEMGVEANSDNNSIKDPVQRLTVTVENNGKETAVETDENGNAIKTISTVDTKTEVSKNQNEPEENHSETKDDNSKADEQGMSFKTPIFNNNIDNVNDVPEVVETPTYTSAEASEIMDQILDHIKVNIRPDVDELELQLHPASLGNVKINLTANKAGEITAEFKVQNENVRAAVEAQLQSLRETFESSGNKVTAIEVSVDTQSFDENLWNGQQQNTNDGQEPEKKRQRRINVADLDALFADEDATEEEILAAEMLEASGGTVDYTA